MVCNVSSAHMPSHSCLCGSCCTSAFFVVDRSPFTHKIHCEGAKSFSLSAIMDFSIFTEIYWGNKHFTTVTLNIISRYHLFFCWTIKIFRFANNCPLCMFQACPRPHGRVFRQTLITSRHSAIITPSFTSWVRNAYICLPGLQLVRQGVLRSWFFMRFSFLTDEDKCLIAVYRLLRPHSCPLVIRSPNFS